MKLEGVEIRNFRSIKRISFTFPKDGLLVLVGANNAGKSNIVRAINVVCGDHFFGSEKVEDHDHYLRDRRNVISIRLGFDDRSSARWSSDGKGWPTWHRPDDERAEYGRRPKDAFPCIYLGADRTFDKHMSFYDWTLIGKIRRAFHQRATHLSSELNDKFDEVVRVFEQVPGFPAFKRDFARFFTEMQADTDTRLTIDFKPYTPSNYFKTMQIVAHDPQTDARCDLDELGEGSRNMVLLALLRSYALNFRNSGQELNGLLALEEPELYMHPQARRNCRSIGDSSRRLVSRATASWSTSTVRSRRSNEDAVAPGAELRA